MNKLRAIAASALLGLAAQPALPATTSTSFVVQTSISTACSVSATTLDFLTYSSVNASPTDATSTINVYCTVGTTYTVRLNVGTGGGSFATRRLLNGAETLNFNLYTTSGRTVVLGDGTASTQTLSGTGAGLLTSSPHTVHGRMPAGQDKPPGTYQSTITVTVEYT